MTDDFRDDLDDLSSAEDFLDYFGVTYDEKVVHVNRLHILQRFHDYLAKETDPDYDRYKLLLEKAYADFVASDALTEKVFKVFHDVAAAPAQPGPAGFVPLEALVK
ncbi:nitrogenase-stabilizing/protective protein NifW [Magnetospira thiophila]